MAIGKIETSGLTVRNGKVQVRFSFYLEPGDPRYEEHHIQAPVIPEGGYPGTKTEDGIPVDRNDYDQWLDSLPKVWQDNPFHNHFEYVDPDTPDAELLKLMRDRLKEFFTIWSKGQDILKVWKSKGRLIAGDTSPSNIQKCKDRLIDIASKATQLSVRSA